MYKELTLQILIYRYSGEVERKSKNQMPVAVV